MYDYAIKSRALSPQGRENYDRIFRVKKEEKVVINYNNRMIGKEGDQHGSAIVRDHP